MGPRLMLEYVEPGARNASFGQRADERFFVHEWSARRVDEIRRRASSVSIHARQSGGAFRA